MERLWPSVRGQRFLLRRKSFVTDAAWWLFTPTIGKLFSGIVVAVSILVLAGILGAGITADHLRGLSERDTAVGRWPLALQLAAFLLLGTLYLRALEGPLAALLLGLIGALLVAEHRRASDVDLAFFKINALLGFVVLGFIALGLHPPLGS